MPQLFALLKPNYNIQGVGTCKATRKGFDSVKLQLSRNAMRGLFVRLVVKSLVMVITRWKDSKSLQIAGKVIMSGVGEVQRRSG